MAGTPPTAWAYLQQMERWIKNPATFIFGRWEGHPEGGLEGGMDLGSPGGTPVYSLGTGTVIGAGYFCHGGPFNNSTAGCPAGKAPGYGVVTTRINVPGYGTQDLYYQHIDIDPSIHPGMVVQRGQRIGTIRSNVGILEMGFNANWGQPWGTNHPGPWYDDPRPLVKALMLDSAPSVAPTGTGTATGTSSNPLDPVGAITSLWTGSLAPTFKVWGEYIAIFLIATVLIIIGFILLGGGDVVNAAVKP